MSVPVPTILKYLAHLDDEEHYIKTEELSPAPRAKKRRLDHLTWEEKVQRKKLKNRVAAQTSRDRKKAKMEEMEQALQELFYKNEELMKECKELRKANKRLTEENLELRNQRCNCSCNQNRSAECDVQKQGSAVSTIPLPKGSDTRSAAELKTQTVTALWKIVLACLLYQTCSMNSTKTSTLNLWNNLHKASYKISPKIWKQLLKKQIVKNQTIIENCVNHQWWGRHQQNWNPVDVAV